MKDSDITDFLEIILNIIIFVKFFFLMFVITYNVAKGNKSPSETDILYWKKKIEFVYILLMMLIIVFIFFPFSKNYRFLNTKMKELFFLYGLVTIVSLDWSHIFK